MVCLLAILLYTGQNLRQKDRFVITTSEDKYPSYRSYEVNFRQPFPVPSKDSGIYRTSVNIDRPGTYITVYCSNKVSIDDLWGFVGNGLTSLQGRLDGGFSNDDKLENECFNYVKELYFASTGEVAKGGVQVTGEAEPRPLHVSHLIQSHKCTEKLLISLTYQQKILSANWNGFSKTYLNKRLPKILFNKPVKISNVVLNGQFLIKQIEIDFEEALAWSQGQLQYFERDNPSRYWQERTLVGYEPYTGRIITRFILSNNAQVRNFINKFNTCKFDERCTSECLELRQIASLGIKACREFRYRHIEEVERLVPVPADGILYGVKICEPTEWPEEGFLAPKLLEYKEKLEILEQ
ncbi:BgTH12-05271 [Blumeria graminis f. sp. triticale]|uniref:BgTH12-05271 n=1 Tax=Blumeria graminis f. sp. triticale TaxID=1689686 RepID=A0A9W4D213_BLUGR|nr:BgTH12-05271 [Blumeria graminis f. sp. triticale]